MKGELLSDHDWAIEILRRAKNEVNTSKGLKTLRHAIIYLKGK